MPLLTVPAIMDSVLDSSEFPSVKDVRCYFDYDTAVLYFEEPVYGIFVDPAHASEELLAFCGAVEDITDHFGEVADAYVGENVRGKILADGEENYYVIAFTLQQPIGAKVPLHQLSEVGWTSYTPFTGFTLSGYMGYDGYEEYPVDLTFTPESITVSEPTESVDLQGIDSDEACADQLPSFFAHMALLSLPADDSMNPLYDEKGELKAYMVFSRYLDFVDPAGVDDDQDEDQEVHSL